MLLEPWEHAVLVLADGRMEVEHIASVVGQLASADLKDVLRCLESFEREGLVEPAGFARPDPMDRPGPRTLAGLQQAYREWHANPAKTGRILTGQGLEPYPEASTVPPANVQDPTVAVAEGPLRVGDTFVVGRDGHATRSLLPQAEAIDDIEATAPVDGGRLALLDEEGGLRAEDPELDVEALLAAVDDDLCFEEEETQVPPPPPPRKVKTRASGGEAAVPAGRRDKPPRETVQTPQLEPTLVGPLPKPAASHQDEVPTLDDARSPAPEGFLGPADPTMAGEFGEDS